MTLFQNTLRKKSEKFPLQYKKLFLYLRHESDKTHIVGIVSTDLDTIGINHGLIRIHTAFCRK